jgi:hypothetical protein
MLLWSEVIGFSLADPVARVNAGGLAAVCCRIRDLSHLMLQYARRGGVIGPINAGRQGGVAANKRDLVVGKVS